MEQNRKYFIPSLVLLTAMGTGIYGISSAGAEGGEKQASIIERIASKFNLDKSDVQKVFEEERSERQKLMRENFEKRLDEAVDKGELTEAQKKLITEKRAEMEKQIETRRDEMGQNRKNLSSLTEAERRTEMEKRQAEMKKQREDLEAWAKENSIDKKYLLDGHAKRGGVVANGLKEYRKGEMSRTK